MDKFIEKKLSKKRLFPKIETKSSKNYRYRYKEDYDYSKLDFKNSIENQKGINLILSKNNNNKIKSCLYLRTFSCNKNPNKKDKHNNSKNNSNISRDKYNKNKRRFDKFLKTME